jgi:hypothetical protein
MNLFLLILINQSFAGLENDNDVYQVPYSILLHLDTNVLEELRVSDSLGQIIIQEIKRKQQKVCVDDYCIDSCFNVVMPQSIFYPQQSIELYDLIMTAREMHIQLSMHDTLYSFHSIGGTIIIDPPIQIIDACAIHFSSKKDSNGEMIILINDTPYRIVKRKDGSRVLRKADE